MMHAANGNEASFSLSLSFLLHLFPPRSFFLILSFFDPDVSRSSSSSFRPADRKTREEIRELNIAPSSCAILSRLRVSPSLSHSRALLLLLLASPQHRMRPLLTAFKLPSWPPWIFHDHRRRGIPAAPPWLRCGRQFRKLWTRLTTCSERRRASSEYRYV